MSVGPLKDKAGKEVKDSEEMADLLAQHYSIVFREEVLPMQEICQLYNGDSPLLHTQFTEAFVRLQLSSCTPLRPGGQAHLNRLRSWRGCRGE